MPGFRAPLLAYGPAEVATIAYLRSTQCALVISERDTTALRTAIKQLATQLDICQDLSSKARACVARHFTKEIVQKRFRDYMMKAKGAADSIKMLPVVGPFDRSQAAHYDETDCVAHLYREPLSGNAMIDVGAHHGWALLPFLDMGWDIFAFEPDENNRARLLDRLSKHKNKALVTLDTRCVSNKPQKEVSFYRSQESTGISGLSPFHASHVEAQRVDVTTLTEFFQDKPLPEVDFLKIDTEGHDLFVLQGFPWDRGKPAVIECEFEDSKTVPLGYNFHELARFLADKGYTVYLSEWHPIIRYGIRHDWNRLMRYPCELADPKGWGNLLAFRDSINEKDLVAAVNKVLKIGASEKSRADAPATQLSANGQSVKSRALRFEPSQFFKPAGPNQWRYTDSNAPQKLWIAVIDMAVQTTSRTFVGKFRVLADHAMTVDVSLGRYGTTAYEGTTKRIQLAPGVAQSVKLTKKFTQAQTALKLQVAVVELKGGGSALLTLDNLSVHESLASIRRRVGEAKLTLREANRRFREGDASTAMGMYLILHHQRKLRLYSDNALMAARKVFPVQSHTVESLCALLGD